MNFQISSFLVLVGMMFAQLLLALPWIILVFLSPARRQAFRSQPLSTWLIQPFLIVVVLVQLLLELPSILIVFIRASKREAKPPKPPSVWFAQFLLVGLLVSIAIPFALFELVQDRGSLEVVGRIYGAVFQMQLTLDLFILLFGLLLRFWPKGGAIALSAFREGVRQWVFWLVLLSAVAMMAFSILVPYFTFGEDYLMVKQLGYDTIMLAAVLFGSLTASLSISEEIEGRTAITVMSKPVSRRQFMLGKFAGIVLAALFMFGILGVMFENVLLVKHWWDKLDSISNESIKESVTVAEHIGVVVTPAWVNIQLADWSLPAATTDLLRGLGQWTAHSMDTLPGLALCYSQVLVLVALAVTLATRVPMVVNITSVVVVFFLSHLTPALLALADRGQKENPNSTVSRLVGFVARVFDTLLPDLGSFAMNPALLSDAPPPAGLFFQYVASVTLYGVLYTAIVLLLGLILFEDRDLA
jgi:ABC-2 family transporter protein